MYQVAPRMLASSGSTVDSRLAAAIASTPVSPRHVAVAWASGRPGAGAGAGGCTAGT